MPHEDSCASLPSHILIAHRSIDAHISVFLWWVFLSCFFLLYESHIKMCLIFILSFIFVLLLILLSQNQIFNHKIWKIYHKNFNMVLILHNLNKKWKNHTNYFNIYCVKVIIYIYFEKKRGQNCWSLNDRIKWAL